MKIQVGVEYVLKNGEIVQFEKNSLPYYKFSALVDPDHYLATEVWTEDGVAYHDDCGFSVVREAA